MRFRWVLVVLVFGLASRGVEDILPAMGLSGKANVSNLSGIFQYLMMFIGGWILVRISNCTLKEVFGKLNLRRDLLLGGGVGVILLGFTFGVNTWIVWIVAQWAPSFAYKFWNFHAQTYFLAIPVSTYILLVINNFVLAPMMEEFMFRGLMFRSLVGHGTILSITFVGLTFVVLHLPQPYLISTFVFSATLSLLYIRYRSLWPGIFAHALFNTAAFVLKYHADNHYQRSEGNLDELRYWVPELVMFCASVAALVLLFAHCWPNHKERSDQPPIV